MDSKWYRHIKDNDEQTRFKSYIWNSKGVLDRLTDISKDMEQAITNQEFNPDTYDSPTWGAKQAHFNGYRQCLRDISKLITLDPKDKPDA